MQRPMFQNPMQRESMGIMAGVAPIQGYREGGSAAPEYTPKFLREEQPEEESEEESEENSEKNSKLKNKLENSLSSIPKDDIPHYIPWPFGHNTEAVNPFGSDKDVSLKYIKCLKVQLNLEKDINNECLDCPNCSLGETAKEIWGNILEDLLLNSKPKLYRINSQIDTLYDLLISIYKEKSAEKNNDNKIKKSYLVKPYKLKDPYNHYLKHLLSMGISMFDLNITDLSEKGMRDSLLGIPDIVIDKKVFQLYKEEEGGDTMLDKIYPSNKDYEYGVMRALQLQGISASITNMYFFKVRNNKKVARQGIMRKHIFNSAYKSVISIVWSIG